ncbi:MAG: Lipid A biosynthesis lauroyl acyltransferase [Elusimicrobia bacterium ADurb.Bin231]|nr:MAG: Lipid A biosynthesis lauroyl acyltransferase [Elusimicrobia bacterium ADurb.Bin231]
MKKLKHIIEFAAVVIAGLFLRILPYGLVLCLGRLIGDFAFYILKIRRKIVLRNISFVFPEKNESEIKAIARDSYRNIGMSFMEFLSLPRIKKIGVLRFVDFEGTKPLDNLVAEKKGAVLIGAHFGSWELLGAALCAKGYPLDALFYRQHNEYFNNLVESYRKMVGLGLIPLKFALRTCLKSIKRGRFIALLADQDAGRRDGVFVKFFNRYAATNKGPAVFALSTGASIFMGFCIRQKPSHKHKIIFVPVEYKFTGDMEKDIFEFTCAYTKIYEKFCAEYPDHWFWFHKRWKTGKTPGDNFYA